MFALVSGEIFAYVFTCENVILFSPRPENKLNGQIILVFCLKQFLVEVSFSPYSQFTISKEDSLGEGSPRGVLTTSACNLMDCSLLVHGILQAVILEWVAVPFSRGSS